jgi:NAD(P)-dependent dehydrogenase (short-subunit alcohol dehydrogenase family)
VVVFAGARNPDAATDLHELADRSQGKLHIVKLISAEEANNRAAVETIKSIAGRLDVVIANAGASGENTKTILGVPLEDMMYQFTVNTLGPLALIQATYPVLKVSTSMPKFVAISSRCGSITTGAPLSLPQAEPGTSKCALNWMIKKLWHENPDLS